MQYLIEHFGVAVGAMSGVLAARGKRVDLFGVIVLAVVTALGGGTLRDIVLRNGNVFWIDDASFVVSAVSVAVACFFVAKRLHMAARSLLVADAFALAFFTILGTAKGLHCGAGNCNAVVLGVITGVAGGVFRDVLIAELPIVFRASTYLYATAAFAGAALFVAAEHWAPAAPANRWLAVAVVLGLRLLAIRKKWVLPVFPSER